MPTVLRVKFSDKNTSVKSIWGMKLNEAIQINTIGNEYLILNDVNGNPLRINKNDFAMALNEVFATKGLFLLATGITIDSFSDFNAFKDMGVYKVMSTIEIPNAPTSKFMYGTLLVLSQSYTTQIAVSTFAEVYVRSYSNANWSEWKKL